jgi:hypothetical protein
MFKAKHFRAKLAEIAESMKNTCAPSEIRKLEQSMKGCGVLAQNENWLADTLRAMILRQRRRIARHYKSAAAVQSALTL